LEELGLAGAQHWSSTEVDDVRRDGARLLNMFDDTVYQLKMLLLLFFVRVCAC